MKKNIAIVILNLILSISIFADFVDLGTTTGQPASIKEELFRLNAQIDNYNLLNEPNLESAVNWVGRQTQVENGGPKYTLNLTDFDGYIMFKWGNRDHFYFLHDVRAEPDNQWSAPSVFYHGGGFYTFFSDNFIDKTTSIPTPLGLSHYTEFVNPSPIPETGTWLMCLALLFPIFLKWKNRKFESNI